MAKQFKKGDVVWSITNWDGKATVKVDLLTIQSWGKKLGTASQVKDGQMIKSQIYIGQDDHLFLASDVQDINAFALEVATKQRLNRLAFFADCDLHHYLLGHFDRTDKISVNYHAWSRQQTQEVIDAVPTVLFQEAI
jgi:hypothetical protein